MPQNRFNPLLRLSLVASLCVFKAHAQEITAFHGNTAEPTGRLIIKYRSEDSSAGLAALQGDEKRTDSLNRAAWRNRQGVNLSRKISRNQELINTGRSENLANLQQQAALLASQQDVATASVEYRRYTLQEPNDPLYRGTTTAGTQSYLYEGPYSMHAPGAWDVTMGSQDAVIAIVDTGVLPNHPELLDRAIPALGYDFVAPDAPGDFLAANDGDGRDADPTDPGDHCGSNNSSWHGTGVASVAAGNSNNAEGLAGIDWNARLLHARALGRCGGTDADIIDAIRWSAGLPVPGLPVNQTPATVVNLSIGGPTECTPAWQDVINELNDLNIPFVIAAGNEANNALRSSPANCADVITVGSSTPGGSIDRGFSNYGIKVTVAAPGRDIVMATNSGQLTSDSEGQTYQTETGSSFSAALVSGAISLMQSVNSDLSPAQVRSILQDSATPFIADSECSTYYCGTGVMHLTRAITLAQQGTNNGSGNAEERVIENEFTPLPLDLPLTGNLFGARDMRYYKVSTQQAGMLTINSSSSSDLYAYLLDDKLGVLALDDDSGGSLNFRVASRVPAGDYYIAVERSVHRAIDREATFEITASLSTDQPDPFTFRSVSNAAVDSQVRSDEVTISGLLSPAIVTVSGGFYSVNDGELTATQSTVQNGDSIFVALRSASAMDAENKLFLSVGAYQTEFSVTTGDRSVFTALVNTSSGGSGCSLMPRLSNSSVAIDPVLPLLFMLAMGHLALRKRSGLQ